MVTSGCLEVGICGCKLYCDICSCLRYFKAREFIFRLMSDGEYASLTQMFDGSCKNL